MCPPPLTFSAGLPYKLVFTLLAVCRFDKAFVSLFWTAAGMGLPDSVHYKYPDESINFAVVFFFASFILILNWTLLQVQGVMQYIHTTVM